MADLPPRTENPRFQLSEHIGLFAIAQERKPPGIPQGLRVAAASHNAILIVMTRSLALPRCSATHPVSRMSAAFAGLLKIGFAMLDRLRELTDYPDVDRRKSRRESSKTSSAKYSGASLKPRGMNGAN